MEEKIEACRGENKKKCDNKCEIESCQMCIGYSLQTNYLIKMD